MAPILVDTFFTYNVVSKIYQFKFNMESLNEVLRVGRFCSVLFKLSISVKRWKTHVVHFSTSLIVFL